MATATKKTIKNDTAVKADTVDARDIREAATGAASRVADGAREFVRRSAATAQERTDGAYEMAEKTNANLESGLKRFVDGYVSVLQFGAKAVHEDATRALTTLEKLAEAKSISQAVQIQTGYLRENTQANIERTRTAFGATRDVVTDGFANVRETMQDVLPYGRKAA